MRVGAANVVAQAVKTIKKKTPISTPIFAGLVLSDTIFPTYFLASR
jgi:hypothetical protein